MVELPPTTTNVQIQWSGDNYTTTPLCASTAIINRPSSNDFEAYQRVKNWLESDKKEAV